MFSYFEQLVSPFKRLSFPVSTHLSKFFLEHTIGIKKYIALIALLSTVIAVTEVYMFKFLGELVDTMSGKSASEFFREDIGGLYWMSFVLLLVLPLAVVIRTLFEHQSLEVNFPVRSLYNLHGLVVGRNLEFFHGTPSGKIANTLLQTSFSAKLVVIKLVNTFTFVFIFFISMSLLLTGIDILLLIPAILWVGGYVFIATHFFPKMKSFQERQASETSEMVGSLVDTYSHITTVKVFSRDDLELRYAASFMSKFLDTAKGNMRIFSKVQFVMCAMNILLIFATFSLSIWLWGSGAITVGAIAAAVSVAFRLYTMSHWIMWELLDVSRNIGVVQHGTKLLSSPHDRAADESRAEAVITSDAKIVFENVNFSYRNSSLMLNDFSLTIQSGEKIGIVGSSGSGKSTIVKLLLRLCDKSTGRISLAGRDITSLDHDQLLEQVSVVTQDVQILNRTIRANLVYGNEDVTEERMIEVSKAVGAHEFISELVDSNGARGYDARAGVSGAKLSGGQRQRVSIVRALLKDADIYVFDEATSALDVVTETRVVEAMRSLLKNKTVLLITHKEPLLYWVDRIIEVRDGKAIEVKQLSSQPKLVGDVSKV